MKNRSIYLAIVALVALMSVFPSAARAQLDAEEAGLLAYIQDVFASFDEQTTYQAEGAQVISQELSTMIDGAKVSLVQVIEQRLSGAFDRDANNPLAALSVAQEVTTVIEGDAPSEVGLTLDITVIADTLYMRVSEVYPAELSAQFPVGWMNVSANPDAIPGATLIDPAQYTRLFAQPANFNLGPENFAALVERESEVIGDQSMRVIEVLYDLPALVAGGEVEQVLGAFDFSQFGMDMDAFLAAVAENGLLVAAVWITPEDTLYRVDTVLDFAGELEGVIAGLDRVMLNQRVTSSITYGGFGEAVDITAPEVTQ